MLNRIINNSRSERQRHRVNHTNHIRYNRNRTSNLYFPLVQNRNTTRIRHNTIENNEVIDISLNYSSESISLLNHQLLVEQLMSQIYYIPSEDYQESEPVYVPDLEKIKNNTKTQYYSKTLNIKNDLCPITMEPFQLKQKIVIMKCLHAIDYEQFSNYILNYTNTCPLCRELVY